MSSPPMLKIELALKGRPMRSYTFAKETVTIGRGFEADIVLDNMGVSRVHARIEYEGGAYFVRDEGSSNGTFVDQRRIDRHRLADGETIHIGKFSLAVGLAGEVPAPGRGLREAPAPPAGVMDGTMVLTSEQLARVLKPQPAPEPAHQPVLSMVAGTAATARAGGPRPSWVWIVALVGAVMVGMALGAAVF